MENLNLFLSILSGLVIGVLANILTPYVSKLLGGIFKSVQKRNEHQAEVFENSVQYLLVHPNDEINLRTEKNGRFMRAFIFLSSALIVASFNTSIISLIGSGGLVFVGLYYFIRGNKYNRLVSAAWRRRKQVQPQIDLD